MKTRKYLICDLCLILLLAVLIFATWMIIVRYSQYFTDLFKGSTSGGNSEVNCGAGGALLIVVILIAISGFIAVISLSGWLIFSAVCTAFAIVGFAGLISHRNTKRINRLLKVYRGVCTLVVCMAINFIYSVVKISSSHENLNIVAPLTLLSVTIGVAVISVIINAFAIKENNAQENLNQITEAN